MFSAQPSFTGTSMFGGATAMPTFGATPAFGTPAPAAAAPFAFGAPTPATPAFSATPAFGQTTSSLFAAPAAAATPNLFGGLRTATAGVTAQPSLFGAVAAPTATATTGMFGAQPSAFGFGATMKKGTGDPKYSQTQVKDGQTTSSYWSITAMDAYAQRSFEELRYEDYSEGRKGGQQQQAGLFGTTTQPQATGGLFGQPAAAASPFGAAPAAAAPAFGGGLFGQSMAAPAASTAPSLFGAPTTTTTGLFGAPAATTGTSLFGAPAATATPAFGTLGGAAASPTGLFGAPAAAAPAFGATTGGLFGATTGGLLGGTMGAAPATSLFGATGAAPATGGLFGATSATPTLGALGGTTSLFGAGATTPSFGAGLTMPTMSGTTTSLFGATPAGGATTPSLFGNLGGAATGGLFGGTTTPAMTSLTSPGMSLGGGLFGTLGQPATATAGLMGNQQPIIASIQDNPYGTLPAPIVLSKENDAAQLARTSPTKRVVKPDPHYKMTPRSSARIYPRGYGRRTLSMYDEAPESKTLDRPEQFTSRIRLVVDSNEDMPTVTPPPTMNRKKLTPAINRLGDDVAASNIPGTPYQPVHDESRLIMPALKVTSPTTKDKGKEKETEGRDDVDPLNTDMELATPMRQQHSQPQKVVPTPQRPTPGTIIDPFAGPASPQEGSTGNTSSDDDDDEMLRQGGSKDSEPSYQRLARANGFKLKSAKETESADPRSSVPILTKGGYYCEPTIEEMEAMSDQELSRVISFEVGRKGVGRVVFPGYTDVRGLDLDTIVQFNAKEVEIYPQGNAPPVGQGLNKPATITLFRVWPKDRNSGQLIKDDFTNPKLMDRWRKRLASSIKISVDKLNYVPATGEWTFDVPNFDDGSN